MPVDLSKSLVIGISSRALFDLEEADRVYEKEGIEAYAAYQEAKEDEILAPGIGFRLIQAIQGLNRRARGTRKAEVVITSRNNPATSIRLFKSIEHHKLDIQRAILTSGTPVARYLKPFCVDLYLSAYEIDVEEAVRGGIAAAVIYQSNPSKALQAIEAQREAAPIPTEELTSSPIDPCDELRIAFDGDNVLFGREAQDVYDKSGLAEFLAHEVKHAGRPLSDGPFAKFIRTLAVLQKDPSFEKPPIRTALVTARNLPTHLRVLNTFRQWGIQVDEAFFMGGVSKVGVLSAFQPHIFFDDQESHCQDAAQVVSTGKVPIPALDSTVLVVSEAPSPADSSVYRQLPSSE